MRTEHILVLMVVAVLGAAAYAVWAWNFGGADGGIQISNHGLAALTIGALGAMAIAGGLMFLVFFSARRGYDEAADEWYRSQRRPPPIDRD